MGLLRALAIILILIWLLGFGLNIGGGLIHIILVIAAIVFIFDMLSGRNRL